MSQKHLLIIDPIKSLNFKLDSSLRLGYELIQKGHEVFVAELSQLSWNIKSPSAQALASEITYENEDIASIRVANFKPISLESFHGIHMRKEPPVDSQFLASTWMLDSARKKTWLFNDPRALRSINEKLSIFKFPDEVDEALVSSNPEELIQFIENKCFGDAILKPLDGYGGKGIFRIELSKNSKEEILERLKKETDDGKVYRLVQPFNLKIFDGEIRAFAVGGKTIGWCLKKPKEGNFMANTSQGAKLCLYKPDVKLDKIISKINSELLKLGIYFVGYDIIGNRISEINITSPRLLVGEGDNYNYYKDIANWVESKCLNNPS